MENSLIREYLRSGNRLIRPEICTDELFDIMLRCWSQNPQERPLFSQLVNIFNENNKRIYVDFSKINAKYIFPPAVKTHSF